ncbi:hypothetical protein GPECTOR_42g808 [Gonium pectorale]|uniref:Uncharacterized protein n=1 Tax=Gonium pectorale TaxID=33097 RepID=A0A150G9S6_GONPE|nr:hypothetical protein GPECTOR_42g808 [Gonium pectorale]|eukprot:KXZ46597.1 hypothetical protein GPECTOR_42g808 [Gonium pectorale]
MDRERSDSMEGAMNLMHLNGIVRQAVKLVRGVRIDQQPEAFNFTVFSVISWFKVREVYPMSGEPRQFKRRDLRRGKALGWVEPHEQELHVRLEWGDPHGGTGTDHFRLISPEELHIESVLRVDGQLARYVTVYHRKPDRHRGGRGSHKGDHDHHSHDDEQDDERRAGK